MKSLNLILWFISISILFTINSCEDFLEKPIILSSITEDDIFSSRENAESFLWQTYKEIIPYGWAYENRNTHRVYRSMLAAMCDEVYYSIGSSLSARSAVAGYNADAIDNIPDLYHKNWDGIRRAWTFIEDVDMVPDIPIEEKEKMKAEAKAMIAMRYSYMLKHYGGVPIVRKRLSVEDDLTIPRATIEEMVDFIVELCDEAALVLPDTYPSNWHGRITKGVALAVKAETLLFAASQVFNTNTPVLDFGENARLISYPSYDNNRWKLAADASKAVIDWAPQGGHHIIDTGNPFDDFGRATSEEDNPEILLAYKARFPTSLWVNYYLPRLGYFNEGYGIRLNIMPMFYKADGTDQEWPSYTDPPVFYPYSLYIQKMEEMESRFKQTAWAYGTSAWNNPGHPRFQWNMNAAMPYRVEGDYPCVGKLVKFVYNYKGGTGATSTYAQDWIVFRLAEFYLNYAEAMNEYTANSPEAYNALNVIRDRAGLPLISPSDTRYNTQETLRQLIRRERAVELFAEEHRFFDVKRWRIAHLPGIVGAPRYGFTYVKNAAGTGYDEFKVYRVDDHVWFDRMYFTPFPIEETNKGILIQNPGY